MAHPAVNTKVELAVESIEDLAVAVCSRDHDAVQAARKLCADSLRDLLQPVIRVMTNNGERVG
jgi:hypothetical protein